MSKDSKIDFIRKLSESKIAKTKVDAAKGWVARRGELVKKWFIDQAKKAKTAWTTVVAVAALLGYNLSITPIEEPVIVEPAKPSAVIHQEIEEIVELVQEIKEEVKPEVQEPEIKPETKAVRIKDGGTTVIINGKEYQNGQVGKDEADY